jgi:hypothetical protein
MKICHRYRNLIDTSLEKNKTLDMNDWIYYTEDKTDCKIFINKDDKHKLAVKKVVGLFAKEIAYTFWSIDENTKLEWDQSVQSMKILEVLSPNCAILHIKMKRIWPTKARDCVVCTEILQVADDEWVVNNISIEHPLTHIVESEYVRMPTVNVNMCIKEELINKSGERTRDNIISTITYNADIDVGNWVSNVVVHSMCHKTWAGVLDELCKTIKKKL